MVAREVLRSIYEAQRKAVAAENANENVLTREVCPDKTGSLSSAGMDYQASDEGRSERLLSRKEAARSCGVGVSLGPTLTRCVLVSGHQEHCVRLGELGRGTLRNRKIQFFFSNVTTILRLSSCGEPYGGLFGVQRTVPQPVSGSKNEQMARPPYTSDSWSSRLMH